MRVTVWLYKGMWRGREGGGDQKGEDVSWLEEDEGRRKNKDCQKSPNLSSGVTIHQGLTGPQKHAIAMVMSVTAKGCRLKSAKEKGAAETRHRAPSCLLLVEFHRQHSILPGVMCDNTLIKCCQSWCAEFSGDQSIAQSWSTHIGALGSSQSPASFGGSKFQGTQKYRSHNISINDLLWLRSSRQWHGYQVWYFMGPEVMSLEPVRTSPFSDMLYVQSTPCHSPS